MSYIQYTKCVDVKNKVYPGKPLVVTVIAAIATLLAGGGLTPYTAIPLLLILIGFCSWWLYDRLVCLCGERCAIGLAGVVEPPDAKSGFEMFDTDYSINLVLAPHQYQELPPGQSTPRPEPLRIGPANLSELEACERLRLWLILPNGMFNHMNRGGTRMSSQIPPESSGKSFTPRSDQDEMAANMTSRSGLPKQESVG
jgi:hypothetical protein